jgi:calcineurin-like phosphoesterase family protein/2'-5' RNA ligase
MTHYLIEVRFHGKAKYAVDRLTAETHSRFNIKTEKHPHMTLAGPFYTDNEKKLVGDFNRLCTNSDLIEFLLEDYGFFEDTRVVFIGVKPSDKLDSFRWNLSQQLQPYCKLSPYDYKRDFNFHVTIASHIPSHKFENVKKHIKSRSKINFNHVMVRATLLKGGLILREYDFFLRRPLVRSLAKDHGIYSRTMDLLKAHFENEYCPDDIIGRYDQDKNTRKTESYKEEIKAHQKTEEIESGVIENVRKNGNEEMQYSEKYSKKHRYVLVPKKSTFQSIRDYFNPPRTFLISDLHLDHVNIIRYCKRPFHNVNGMNTVLVNNWNRTVRRKDTVYFLGDMSFGKGSRSADYWLSKLNGNIIFIRGFSIKPSGERNQHDRISRTENVFDNLIIDYKDKRFFLVHDPDQVPQDWKEWAICGHHHNNKQQEFPFINGKNKRINVSVELINYQPLDIDKLFELDFENIEFMETVNG